MATKLVPLPWHQTAQLLVQQHRLTYLVGDPGTGKSTFARELALQLTGQEPVVLYGSPVTDVTELFGRWSLVGSETQFTDGAVPLALKQRRILICEEFSLIPMELRIPFLALRSGERELLNVMNGETLHIPDEFRCICVSNKESLKCRRNGEAFQALLSDFLILEVPQLKKQQIEQMLRHQFPSSNKKRIERVLELYDRFRTVERFDSEGQSVLTFRSAAHLLRLLKAGLDEDHAVTIALVNQYITDEDQHTAQQLKHSMSMDE